MAENDAVEVLVDGITFGSTVYRRGSIIWNPTQDVLDAVEDETRHPDTGDRFVRKLSRSDAQKQAKREERGDEVIEPLVQIQGQPSGSEDDVILVPTREEDDEDDEDDEDEDE